MKLVMLRRKMCFGCGLSQSFPALILSGDLGLWNVQRRTLEAIIIIGNLLDVRDCEEDLHKRF